MTTTKRWSKTINLLALNVVAGVEDNKYFCPVFGTTHTLPSPRNDIQGQRNMRLFYYRGHSYFIKEIYNTEKQDYYYMFGLFLPSKKGTNELPALCNIVMISKKIDHAIFFDTSGKLIGDTPNAYSPSAFTGF